MHMLLLTIDDEALARLQKMVWAFSISGNGVGAVWELAAMICASIEKDVDALEITRHEDTVGHDLRGKQTKFVSEDPPVIQA